MESTVYNLLKTLDADVYPATPSQDTPLPYVTYGRTATESYLTMTGPASLERADLTVEIWATDFDALDDLANDVAGLLNGYKGSDVKLAYLTDDVTDPEPRAFHRSQIYSVTYSI